MKKYYLINEQKPIGPFSVEDLVQKNINPDDLIWYDGLEQWIKAETIIELSEYFNSKSIKINHEIPKIPTIPPPPPFSSISSTSTEIPKIPNEFEEEIERSKRINKIAIVSIIGFLVLCVIGIILYSVIPNKSSNNEKVSVDMMDMNRPKEETAPVAGTVTKKSTTPNNSGYKTAVGNPNAPKMEINERERKNPTDYLYITCESKGKIFSKKESFKCTITNSADFTDFSDIVISITWNAKTGTVIYTQNFIVYENVNSKSSITFKKDLFPPEGATTYNIKVKDATGSVFGPM